jgi:transposase
MRTTDARSLSSGAQEDLRRKAVAAVRAGQSKSEAARLFGVARQTAHTWMNAYHAGGAAGLRGRRRGRRPGKRLNGQQAALIRRRIRDRHPDQLKLPFYLWTREAVQRAAKRERAGIYWADAMGLRSDQAAGRSYAPRGRTPAIPTAGNRFGCHMLSAIGGAASGSGHHRLGRGPVLFQLGAPFGDFARLSPDVVEADDAVERLTNLFCGRVWVGPELLAAVQEQRFGVCITPQRGQTIAKQVLRYRDEPVIPG